MDEGNNELWQAFFTEVSEQLDNLEVILADNDAESNADIHQLFRDFHTIKSSCAMMDFHSMKNIAHASEDYLDLVRKRRTPLTKPAINHLLNGIDWLKSQLQLAKNTGNAPPENTELVEILRSLSATIKEQKSQVDLQDNNNKTGKSSELNEARLSEDEINEFASACRQELLVGLAPGTETTKIKRSLNKLVSICTLVGFTAISSLLKKYIKFTNPLNENRAAAIASEIIERIITLENLYSVDCGSAALRTLFLDAMFVDFAQLSGRLGYLLDLIENNPDDTKTIEQCESLLLTLGINASLFGYGDLLNFFRYVLQTIRSIRRGDIPDRRAAFYAVRQAIDFPIAETVEDGETDLVRTELQMRLSDLNFGISQAIYSAGNDTTREKISSLIEIDTTTLNLLMPESLSYLNHIVEEGKKIYEIDIDIDCDPQLMDSLICWVSENGEIIHNRSVFDATDNAESLFSNYICFIAAFKKNSFSVEEFLQTIDTDNRAFRCRNIRYQHENEATAESKKKPLTTKAVDTSDHNATLRIESHTLDSLVAQAGEMLMAHNMIGHEIFNINFENSIVKGKAILADNDSIFLNVNDINTWESIVDTLFLAHKNITENNNRMQKSVNNLQSRILDLRVIPVSSVFNRIPQLVRKMAETQNKRINLIIEGKEVRIDKGMVDILMEPLIHLVRNCIDHGIEQSDERLAMGKPSEATLTLSAFQEGSTLILEIADDGRGINLQRIRESAVRKGFIQESDILSEQETCKLIFLPGFSTTDGITETSARGVGMDVVITRINHIGGDIDVHTNPGHGTRFTMTLPLSAAIQSVIMTSINERRYAIPQNSVIEILSLSPDSICSIHGQSAFILQNNAVPLFNLDDLVLQKGTTKNTSNTITAALHFPSVQITKEATVIVMGQGLQRIGVRVDAIQGREDVFVRELHRSLRSLPSICGATALGNGELVFILNSNFLLQYAGQGSAAWLNQSEASAT